MVGIQNVLSIADVKTEAPVLVTEIWHLELNQFSCFFYYYYLPK